MIGSMIQSRTWYGLHHYLQFEGLYTHNGIIHLLPRKVLFDLFGTTVYTLRLSAVIFGFAATPLLYWLVRRVAGVGGAVVATVLLISAPEQLFWSRIEDTHIAAVAVLALLTAHVALWIVQRGSVWSALVVALWMPGARLFYAAGWNMFAYPVLVYCHATVFVRGAWRRAWYVVPLLAAGVAAWIFSVSLVYWYVGDGDWRFVHPAMVYSNPAWRMRGATGFRDAGLLQLVRLQAATIVEGLGEVIAGICYDRRGVWTWFDRAVVLPNHAAVLNAGGVVLGALGLGYLLGQLTDPRAFMLLVWLALGVAPSVMSGEPFVRRLASIFPSLYALSGLFVAAVVRLVRDCCGRSLALVAMTLAGVAVGGIAWTSLASHFQLPTGPVFVAPAISFTQSLFEENDLILHQFSIEMEGAILFGNLDAFLTGRTCYQSMGGQAWSPASLHAALDLPCDFDSGAYLMTMPPERREALQRQYAPRRAAFLFAETPEIRPLIDMIARLYPHATVTHSGSAKGQLELVSLSVDAADARALHTPWLLVPADAVGDADLVNGLLSGMHLTRVEAASEDESKASEIIVRGGMLLSSDGWYGLTLAPACDDAVLRLDGRPVSLQLAPLLAGVHPFDIRLRPHHACQLPLHVELQSDLDPRATPMPATQFVGPAVASLAAAQAPPATAYAGYGETRVLAWLSDSSIDLGIDAEHHLTALSFEEGGHRWRVQRFDTHENEAARWYPEVPLGSVVHAMAVDADGTIILSAETWVLQYDRAGNRLAAWELPWHFMPQDIALAPDGAILLAVPSRDAIAVFERNGELRAELKTFQGGPGRLIRPAAIAVEPHGKTVVLQDDGQALLFEMAGDPLHPEYVGTFHVAFASAPILGPIFAAGSCAFDGNERLLIRSGPVPLVYSTTGERLLAATPTRDLGTKGLGDIRRFIVSEDSVYALAQGRIWRIAR
jgi:hypothetical protein